MAFVENHGAKIYWDDEGQGAPVLLIMGLGAASALWWRTRPALAARYRTIALDNRGVGQSDVPPGPYPLAVMASDAAVVLDAAGLERAHVFGLSMGGMIAQEIAITFPDRVRSLISIMSTTGNPDLPQPSNEAVALLTEPQPQSRDKFITRFKRNWKVLRAGRFPEDEALDRSRAERIFDRGLNPAGVQRQIRAVLSSGSRKERLSKVKAPTLVIHGTADPLVDPKAAQDTAASIPDAKLVMVQGMGHALPMAIWPEIIDAIDKHAHGASAKAA
jgi:pimeloyl-ACP methyl ester carboxylesterase